MRKYVYGETYPTPKKQKQSHYCDTLDSHMIPETQTTQLLSYQRGDNNISSDKRRNQSAPEQTFLKRENQYANED